MEVSVRFFAIILGVEPTLGSKMAPGQSTQEDSHTPLCGKLTTSQQNTMYQTLASLNCNKFPKPPQFFIHPLFLEPFVGEISDF